MRTLAKDRPRVAAGAGAALALLLIVPLAAFGPKAAGDAADACVAADTDPPAYYKIDLVPTGRIPGTKRAAGVGYVTFARSPFAVAVSPEGSYVYDLSLSVAQLRPPRQGVYVAWVSTPDLDQVRRLGVLDAAMQVKGRVDWNKFLVIITLEPSADDLGATWTGPVVLRGLSRSGLMHTMAGHGPYQQEPCATYGFN